MTRLINKTFLILCLSTYSSLWFSNHFSMFDAMKKYNLYEQVEKNVDETNLDNKTKTLFLMTMENISCINHDILKKNNINSIDLFRAKEYALKNDTPPPKSILIFARVIKFIKQA